MDELTKEEMDRVIGNARIELNRSQVSGLPNASNTIRAIVQLADELKTVEPIYCTDQYCPNCKKLKTCEWLKEITADCHGYEF